MQKFWFLIVGVILLAGCLGSSGSNSSSVNSTNSGDGILKAKSGDFVRVDYVLTVNGTVFDTSLRDVALRNNLSLGHSFEPLGFTIGSGQVIPGFDVAATGMHIGEEKNFSIPPVDAYGEVDSSKKILMAIGAVPVGTRLGDNVRLANGQTGKVILINERDVLVDFNHPLAGKTLNFRIIMREINHA